MRCSPTRGTVAWSSLGEKRSLCTTLKSSFISFPHPSQMSGEQFRLALSSFPSLILRLERPFSLFRSILFQTDDTSSHFFPLSSRSRNNPGHGHPSNFVPDLHGHTMSLLWFDSYCHHFLIDTSRDLVNVRKRTCPRFETASVGFEPSTSRLRNLRSNPLSHCTPKTEQSWVAFSSKPKEI